MARARTSDLARMNMQMPRRSGHEATRDIRWPAGWNDRPILAPTANAFDEGRHTFEAAGMDGFISKPMDADSLRSRGLRWLDRGAAVPLIWPR